MNSKAENFRNFLIEHEAYEKFCANILEQHGFSFERVTDRKYMSGVIDSSISWDRTPEGHAYWERLNSTWNEACSSQRVFAPKYKSIW